MSEYDTVSLSDEARDAKTYASSDPPVTVEIQRNKLNRWGGYSERYTATDVQFGAGWLRLINTQDQNTGQKYQAYALRLTDDIVALAIY